MAQGPIDSVLSFWRPAIDSLDSGDLATYREPGSPLARGINVWRTDDPAGRYWVGIGEEAFSLHAAVCRIEEPPYGAEVVVEISDGSGAPHSYVLWFPATHSVVVPFDPDAVVRAFHYEEHVPGAKRTVLPRPVLNAYYAIKPIVPAFVRRGLRGLMARRASSEEHFLSWPTDQSLDRLQRLMLRLVLLVLGRSELQFAWFWPDGHPWAAVLTHDVETADGCARVTHVAGLERERGLRSSFNFVPLDYETPQSLREELQAGGFEVGVHGLTHDGSLCSSPGVFGEQAPQITEYARQWGAVGFRSPATYRDLGWFQSLGFEYDSSVSNSARFEPQPGGCASFFPYRAGDLIELPITLPQDHTLFALLGEKDTCTWLETLDEIRDANGLACVLGHPDPAPGYIGTPENEAHYVTLLEHLTGSAAWMPLPRELARWWRRRAETPVERLDEVEGMRFGTASLDASGRLVITPPEHGSPSGTGYAVQR